MAEGLLGLSMTNGSPFVAPTRAKKAALSTNPIAIGTFAQGDDRFHLDMATSAVAIGKVEVQSRKGEPIPEGWGLDRNGQSTTDPDAVINGGFLQPLGGSERTSGYKGYGLGLMVCNCNTLDFGFVVYL
jgi:LDH2 family malate/lactate/ureidoglycolate dehydrogenase